MIHRISILLTQCYHAQIKSNKIIKRRSYYREVLENFDYHKEIICFTRCARESQSTRCDHCEEYYSFYQGTICLFYKTYISKKNSFFFINVRNLFILTKNTINQNHLI